MIYELKEDIKLMCIRSPNGPDSAAFDELENGLPSLKGRRFYGLFKEDDHGELYLACVRIEGGDNPQKLGFQSFSIPSGKYDREKLDDWENKWDGKNIEGLPELFQMMEKRNRGNIDDERFSVEYYRSQKELYAMLPLKK